MTRVNAFPKVGTGVMRFFVLRWCGFISRMRFSSTNEGHVAQLCCGRGQAVPWVWIRFRVGAKEVYEWDGKGW